MRKQQLIQLLQFLVIWWLLRAFIVFVMEQSFTDFVLKYRLYLLIVSVSYFYYYSIQYEPDKKHELIRNIVIYGNVYLFLHIFFRPQLNISHQLFVLLWLIILGIRWTTKLKTRWKYLLRFVWWIFTFFIMISGMFYFYPEAPDIDWFLKNRSTEIQFLWVENRVDKSEAYVQISNNRGSNSIEIVPYFTRSLSEDLKISYPSLRQIRDEIVVIITPEWDLFQLFPQSEIALEFSWKNLKTVSKLNWKVWFLSWTFDSALEYSWEVDFLTPEQQEQLEWIENIYKSDVVMYLKSQISKSNISRANNTMMYNLDGKIVKILSKIFPASFNKNERNYKEFQKYFSRFDGDAELWRQSLIQLEWNWWINSLRWNLKENINIWRDNTYKVLKN